MRVVKPPRIRKGDLIGLASPAGTPAPAEKIEQSVRYLEARGYQVQVGEHAAAEYGYLAGRDEQRAADFNAMIRDPEVKAIFALRGGYGTPRILPRIDYAALRRTPKIISGFSDITALQLAILRRCGLVTFSGPMPAVEFWNNPDPYTEEEFWRLITSTNRIGPLKNPPDSPLEILRVGSGAGTLFGGNLALVCATLATPFFPKLAYSVLVLEDVDEAPYRVDRMLTQLRNSGVFRRVKGVLLGQFTGCEPKDRSKPHFSSREVLDQFASAIPCPVFANLQYGHVPRKLTIPFGLEARLDSARAKITIDEPAVI